MTSARLNRVAAILPLTFSALAFAIVMTNVLSGVPPQPDETASAHLWQALIVLQLPLILVFAATANWRTASPALLIGAQFLGIAIACIPVWLAGY